MDKTFNVNISCKNPSIPRASFKVNADNIWSAAKIAENCAFVHGLTLADTDGNVTKKGSTLIMKGDDGGVIRIKEKGKG